MKTALVTGGSGFVGRHMIAKLQSMGFATTTVDYDFPRFDCMDLFLEESIVYDLVVHAAAAAPHRKAIDTQLRNFPYNVMLDSALFNWAIRTGQRHVVYLSSSAIYPARYQSSEWVIDVRDDFRLVEEDTDNLEEPADVYGMTKLIGERMAVQAQTAGISVTIVRPFSGYGEDQSENFPFRAFVERARRKESPFKIWGSADQVRDWIHIDDIVKAIMTLVEAEVEIPVNLCTGIGTSMLDVANMCADRVGYDPILDVDTSAPMGVFYRVGNPERLNLFYQPSVSIEEGIQRALGMN